MAATDFIGEAGTFVFFGVKFLLDVMYQKLLKSVDSLQSYSENEKRDKGKHF